MLAEIRISWFLLFLLTLSCAVKHVELTGTVSLPLCFMVLCHGLYANATAKGEHYVPPTWDIFYEKYGWMLAWWNLAGVPFLYCAQSVFILSRARIALAAGATVEESATIPPWLVGVLTVALLAAYYVWDTANSQKNHFRLVTTGGTVADRWTFPKFSFGTIANPRHIVTQRGTPLLTDGWYRYARKIHYTADIVMAVLWGASCGFTHFIPFFYAVFFTSMIIHRYLRDDHRCAVKYGDDWKRYVATVPYVFIPGLV